MPDDWCPTTNTAGESNGFLYCYRWFIQGVSFGQVPRGGLEKKGEVAHDSKTHLSQIVQNIIGLINCFLIFTQSRGITTHVFVKNSIIVLKTFKRGVQTTLTLLVVTSSIRQTLYKSGSTLRRGRRKIRSSPPNRHQRNTDTNCRLSRLEFWGRYPRAGCHEGQKDREGEKNHREMGGGGNYQKEAQNRDSITLTP